jgi:tyrosine-protein kinase Etk/Wzc
LQTIQQRLTTRENLLAMIDRHDLYTDLPLSNDEKVHLLRMAVRFQTVAAAAAVTYGSAPPVSAMIIFAQTDDPAKSARVANDFAQSMLDAGAETQTGRAQEAVTFFAEEERRVAAELAVLESQVAAYKNDNGDALPALRDMRREEIVGIESDLRGIEGNLAALTSELDAIRAPGRTLRETDRRQIDTLTGQIATLTAQRASLVSQRERLVIAMARMPEVERALSGYERRLDQLRAQYDQVTRRLAEADTAAKLEERQQSERFALLERAVIPELPVSGGRRKLAMAGAFASFVMGIGVAFLLDLMNPVVRTAAQMERQLGLRPMVSIPDMRQVRPRRPDAATLLGDGRMQMLSSPSLLGLPRYAVLACGVALFLALAAAVA